MLTRDTIFPKDRLQYTVYAMFNEISISKSTEESKATTLITSITRIQRFIAFISIFPFRFNHFYLVFEWSTLLHKTNTLLTNFHWKFTVSTFCSKGGLYWWLMKIECNFLSSVDNVCDKHKRHLNFSICFRQRSGHFDNSRPSYFLWRTFQSDIQNSFKKLGDISVCDVVTGDHRCPSFHCHKPTGYRTFIQRMWCSLSIFASLKHCHPWWHSG